MTSRYTEGPVDTVVPLQKIPSTRKATAVFKTSLSQTNLSGIAMGHRVVLDGRTELCCLRPPFGVSLDPENQCPGGIGERVNLRRGWFGLRAGGFVSTRNVTGYAVNEKLVLHPDHQAHGGWRGPLAVQRTHKGEPSTLFAMASRVIERAVSHGHAALVRSDVDDSAWMQSAISSLLGVDDPLQQAKAVIELAACCQRVLAQQPSVARVAAPVKIFGDIHGQLLDVLLLFATYGSPTHSGGDVQTTSYIFNGDFVDRGAHQLEVVVLLFSLKIMYPDQIFLLRGNHEFRSQNLAMRESGFFHHLARRMPLATARLVFEQVHACFDWLPLAAIAGGIVLVIHGGIGDGSWTPEVQSRNLASRVAQPIGGKATHSHETRPPWCRIWRTSSAQFKTSTTRRPSSKPCGPIPLARMLT